MKEEGAGDAPKRNALTIVRGSHVVLRDNEGSRKVAHLVGDKPVHMGKYAGIPIDAIVGLPYGATLRWSSGAWTRQRPYSFEESGFDLSTEGAGPAELMENNRHLLQDGSAQSLGPEDIKELKGKCSGEELVAVIASSSSTFATKTKFSQEKYLKKKQMKHVQQITLLKPTVMELSETYLKNSRQKACGLRFDYLSSMIRHADVRTGGRYLVLDCAMGLVTGAMAQQLGGCGRIFRIFSGGCPDGAFQALDLGELAKVVIELPLDVLQSASPMEHEWARLPMANDAVHGKPEADPTTAAARLEKATTRAQQRRKSLEDFHCGLGVDAALVVAPEGDEDEPLATGVLTLAEKRLAPGGHLLVFGHNLQPLADRQGAMRASGDWVDVRLMQLFTREYQVLPQRTHPHMAQDLMHCDGFILLGIRVVDMPDDKKQVQEDPETECVVKRQRLATGEAD